MMFDGINDLGHKNDAGDLQVTYDRLVQGYSQMVTMMHTAGIPVFASTITPISASGYNVTPGRYSGPLHEQYRVKLNDWNKISGEFDHVVDFAAVVQKQTAPSQCNTTLGHGDYVHYNPLGCSLMADAFYVSVFSRFAGGTILQLIESGAEEFGDEKVVGFTTLKGDGEWECHRYSFPQLCHLAEGTITQLSQDGLRSSGEKGAIVSLLCPTGLDFLVSWTALMKMGYGVLFIAPQCSPSAVNNLLSSSSSIRLVYHSKYANLAKSTRECNPAIPVTELSTYTSHTTSSSSLSCPSRTILPESISHVFHTSGTSGTPKPIPHTHLQSVSVLPRRSPPSYIVSKCSKDGMPASESAAFTTTPLFHGGVSDLLRAWMARSMIYFYPTSDTPITAQNVLDATAACQTLPQPLPHLTLTSEQVKEREKRFRVTSFLSVPYILTILSEDLDGQAMEMLREMELVSTGGAPLDKRVGDAMVERGVKMVSRLGSSECGFLLTSYRDYETERDWEWLRNDSAWKDALVFEAADGEKNRYEMVVTKQWSSKTKSNRDDGSYATGDLYELHPTKPDVWRYAGRGDDVIVLSNGEKASPGPIESILRSSSHLSDALVVGANRSQLGVLLFPREHSDTSTVLSAIGPLLDQANQSSPSFAQVSKDLCIVCSDSYKTLPKSSKGTVQRGLANEHFRSEIEQLYASASLDSDNLPRRTLTEVKEILRTIILDVSKNKPGALGHDADLFSWGVDSLMATRIRSLIQTTLNTGGRPLPINVVFEKPSVTRLAQYVSSLQENGAADDAAEEQAECTMRELAAKYSQFDHPGPTPAAQEPPGSGHVVVLTGGTGSLGSNLIDRLSRLPPTTIRKIVCLVRAPDDSTATQRITDGMRKRGLRFDTDRLQALAADTTRQCLGLAPHVYESLIRGLEIVIHAAWPVHFASSLVSFEDSIKGTRNLLALVQGSHSTTSKLYYCSSLASVLGQTPAPPMIHEIPSHDPTTASSIGYAQSKWVAEQVCFRASQSGLRERVHVLRVGQLCGDTSSGHWNEKEGWPLMIRTAQTTGCLPLLLEKPSWLPVDLAAEAITEIVTNVSCDSFPIYHIVHPLCIDWQTILDALDMAGVTFERVPPKEWLDRVAGSSDDMDENPSKQMLWLWQNAYVDESKAPAAPLIDTNNAQEASKTLRDINPIPEDHIIKMVEAWRRTGYLR